MRVVAVPVVVLLASAASAQTPRGIENLTALARLYGYVRYFHPSDAVASADWDRLAIDSIRPVEAARNPGELASALSAVFATIAPTVVVFATGAVPAAPQLNPAPYLIEWRHRGVGLSEGGSYFSERVTRPSNGAADEIDIIRADLGGGVSCLVPRVLYTEKSGAFRLKPPADSRSTAESGRTSRLAAVIVAWNVMQHFYPYFDWVQTDWSGALTLALRSAASDKDSVEFLGTLRRMIAPLHDGHGRGTLTGSDVMGSPVGWDWVEGRLVITDATHAQGSAVERGDAVIAIQGKPVRQALADAEAGISAATPQWLLARALGTALHYDQALGAIGEGPKAEPLVLEIEPYRQPGARRTVTLERQAYRPVKELRPEPIAELQTGIFYVDVSRATEAGFSAVMEKLQAARGLIFDLRGYPGQIGAELLGHLSRQPMKSAQMLVPVITRPDHREWEFDRSGEWTMPPQAPYLAGKKVVLTDGRAISFSETLLAIVEQYHLAEIVGSPTAGTNGTINPFTVPGGYRISWTGMVVRKRDGSAHHGVGIAPTVAASRTRKGIAEGRDEVLERALSLLR